MPSLRDIRRRIRGTKNVAQITRAMEMVAASKMRRAQRNVLATRPYADRLLDVLGDLTERMVGQARRGTLLDERDEVKHVGLIIVTPDRGLCGSLVTNVLRAASQYMVDQRKQGRDISILAIGRRGRAFMARRKQPIVAEVTSLPDEPKLVDILPIAIEAVNGFREHRYDEVSITYSKFVNTLTQHPVTRRLLPIEPPSEADTHKVDYTYEPSQEEILRTLLPRFFEVQLYQTVLESIASEHSARMVAMRNATNNAKDLVRDLTLTMNKTRQAAITKEISEIAGTAAAMS